MHVHLRACTQTTTQATHRGMQYTKALTLHLPGNCPCIPHAISQRRKMLVLIRTNTESLHPPPLRQRTIVAACLSFGLWGHRRSCFSAVSDSAGQASFESGRCKGPPKLASYILKLRLAHILRDMRARRGGHEYRSRIAHFIISSLMILLWCYAFYFFMHLYKTFE
jgi:hypothetical protein